jgi:nucleoside-diphosphate-sugar epimerase
LSAIVVTGAAGNLGRRVTASLAARPEVERIYAVDLVSMPAVTPVVEVHAFDLAEDGAGDELAALAKDADAVLHLAWHPEGRGNLAILRNVLEASDAVEPSQFLHLSSATVYGAWADNPVPMAEEVVPRPNPELAYAVEKRSAELLVGRWAHEHPEAAVAVLRPACTVGATEQPLYQALAATRKAPIGGHSRVVQYLHVNDLASAVVFAYERGLAGTFNVAPDGGVDERVADALAGGRPALPMPAAVRNAVSAWRWKLWRRGTPPGAQAYAEHSWVIAGDKLRSQGWQPEYSSEEALVVSDERAHWDEVPAARRLGMAVAGATVLAVGAGGALWKHHRR